MAISESRKQKLAMLRRALARGEYGEAADIIAPAKAKQAEPPKPVRLAKACPGRLARIKTPLGRMPYWLIRRTLSQVAPDEAGIARTLASVVGGARQRFNELAVSAEMCRVADGAAADLLFMDLETCGLAGAPIFLVGMMHYADGELLFRQCLARDYTEEPAICQVFARRLASAGVLVTFNGKSFDMTMLRDRSAFHGVDLAAPAAHLDLLHEARRLWRGSVDNCRLQTLERHFCGRARVGDIPSAQIPEAYHRFVDTGDARQIADILHHNLLDLLTMAQLLVAILTGTGPES